MNFNKKFAFAASALMLTSLPALAQVESASSAAALKGIASASLQVPTGFGASWGGVGVGVYGQSCECNRDEMDGSFGVAVGLGDADKYLGLEVAAASSSLFGDTGSGDSFGEVGAFGVKLHTNLPGDAAFAVGVNGIGRWGNNNPNRSSVYASASKFFDLGSVASILTVGIGDNIYNEPGDSGANVFGSAALYLAPQVSLIAEHTGRFTNAGISVAPFKSVPLAITIGGVNLGERYGGDAEVAVAVGYGFNFK